MARTATVRDLRNRFPKVRKLLESEGEVVVTDRGQPRYRLTLYAPARRGTKAVAKDYMERLKRFQGRPLGVSAAKALDEENRGAR